MFDLSIEHAVDDRACELKGCVACPYQVRPYAESACILEGGEKGLSAILTAGELLGRDSSEHLARLKEATDPVSIGGVRFEVIDASYLGSLANLADELRTALEESGIVEGTPWFLKNGSLDNPEFELTVRTWWTPEADETGTLRPALEPLRIWLQQLAFFARGALALDRGVEVGRYELGFVDRSRDPVAQELRVRKNEEKVTP
jgi:hypothetical protein